MGRIPKIGRYSAAARMVWVSIYSKLYFGQQMPGGFRRTGGPADRDGSWVTFIFILFCGPGWFAFDRWSLPLSVTALIRHTSAQLTRETIPRGRYPGSSVELISILRFEPSLITSGIERGTWGERRMSETAEKKKGNRRVCNAAPVQL